MMGSTLLSVGAAELGDRAHDGLAPAPSYRGHLKGPFLMLSETPTNDAVNFVTGAGGFLQQVIFGYTGLRLGSTRRRPPAFPPDAAVERHAGSCCATCSIGGKRYDVVVDVERPAHAPRASETIAPVIAAVGAGPASSRHSRRRRCSPFPSRASTTPPPIRATRPGSIATRRTTRSRSTSTPRSGRVVNLWADAADESLGFTVRDPRGRPAGSTGPPTSATVGDSGGRPYAWSTGSPPQCPERADRMVRAGLDAGGARLPVRQAPPRAVHRGRRSTWPRSRCWSRTSPGCPTAERQRHLELLRRRQRRGALRARLQPALAVSVLGLPRGAVRVRRPSLDGRNRLVLELRGRPAGDRERGAGPGAVAPLARATRPVRLTVRVTTDADAAHAALRATRSSPPRSSSCWRGAHADSAGDTAARRLEREVRSVELLEPERSSWPGCPISPPTSAAT